jgi:predicted ABC-type transport system involved in lysophospholipase L1 biosynthesis ATPase subunit
LLPTLTAEENVLLPYELTGGNGRVGLSDGPKRARELLENVGLLDRRDHYPIQLSGGEQQRVALARAFMVRPPILLADEPTGNLDFRTGEMIASLLDDLHRSHRLTSIYVTHNISFASRCDRVLQLEKGILAPWSDRPKPGEGWLPSRSEQEQPMILGDGGNYV